MYRLFKEDTMNLTVEHVANWVHYMRYAGVCSFAVYDNCHDKSECRDPRPLLPGVQLAYTEWPEKEYFRAQYTAYHDALEAARSAGVPGAWMIQHDFDEFPVFPQHMDKMEPGYLLKYVDALPPDVSQVIIQTMFYGGPPVRGEVYLPRKYTYRSDHTEGPRERTKPIFRIAASRPMAFREVHRMRMAEGKTLVVDPGVLRSNHYWGTRYTDPPIHDESLALWVTQRGLVWP